MKKLIILFSLIIPLYLNAQNWTAEEKAILEKAKISWQSWEEAVNQKDLSIWLEKTNPSDHFVSWLTGQGGIRTLDNVKSDFEMRYKNIERVCWSNVTPLKIRVTGDVGFIWYYASFVVEQKDGTIMNGEHKRFEVHRKINNEWRWEAGMVHFVQP